MTFYKDTRHPQNQTGGQQQCASHTGPHGAARHDRAGGLERGTPSRPAGLPALPRATGALRDPRARPDPAGPTAEAVPGHPQVGDGPWVRAGCGVGGQKGLGV